MNTNITKILQEIYEIDPELREYEDDLVKIVNKLMSSRPDTKFDQAFASKLRLELIDKKSYKHFNINFMNKLFYGFGGAVVASLLLVPAFYLTKGGILQQAGNPLLVEDYGLTAEPKITLLEDNAFGSIIGDVAVSGFAAENTADDLRKTRPQSGGGGGGLSASQSALSYPAPGYPEGITQFRYVYTGELVDIGQPKLEVLKRNVSSSYLGGLAERFGLGLADFQNLGSLKFENVMMVEDKASPLRISVDLKNGELSISNDGGFAQTNGEYRPIKPEEIPSTDELIDIAGKFIKKFNINLAGYSEPIIQDNLSQWLELSRIQPDYYLPEIISVVYPLTVKGTKVYDQGGNTQGISVSISVRSKQVVSVYGINVQQYDASLYSVETDIEKLLKAIQDNYQYPAEVKVNHVDVNLGTPELVYVAIYHYDQVKGEQRLFVPAFKFPVLEKPQENLWFNDYVITPLVIDLIPGYGNPIQFLKPIPTEMSNPAIEPEVDILPSQ